MGKSEDYYNGDSEQSFIELFRGVDFLNIGHVCHDIIPGGMDLGGTVSYASIVAKKLGNHPGIITSHGLDFQFTSRFQDLDIPLYNFPSTETTTFENIYIDEYRSQYLRQRADKIPSMPSLSTLENLQMIQLGLIADEVDNSTLDAIPSELLIGASIQGWLRAVDQNQKVYTKRPDLSLFESLNIAFMSTEDLGNQQDLLSQIIDRVPITVVTKGYQGAQIYTQGKKHIYGAYPCSVMDPTGAGDVFSTSFMIAFNESSDIDEAAAFAHSAASISIEGTGISSIPNREQVEERKQIYLDKYL